MRHVQPRSLNKYVSCTCWLGYVDNAEYFWRREGDEYVLDGHKWWASGAMDPRCRLAIFMGKTDPGAPPHRQQSMLLVPLPAAGARVVRPLSVFGYDDAPHGHAEMLFQVRSQAVLRHRSALKSAGL